jgi:pimeloyl-ACP methyl ester carboxylesterase/DNA-binding CsgD family transcriptional regulator
MGPAVNAAGVRSLTSLALVRLSEVCIQVSDAACPYEPAGHCPHLRALMCFNRVTVTLPAIQYAKTTDGVHVAYFSIGEGPPIVFASNIFGDAHFYRHLARHHVRGVTDGLVKRGWTVVRYDVRGMGGSDRQVDDLSLDARVRDLEAVVNRLGLERFALSGLDIAAATALAYLGRNAERVSQLVLVSPWISGAEMFALPDLRVASGMIASGDREWNVFTNVLGNVASAFEDVRLGKEMAAAMRASTDPEGLAAYYKTSASIDLAELVARVAVPTLVIHEPAFPFGSRQLCEEVAKRIRNAQLAVVREQSIAGSAHDGHIAAIDDFLRSDGRRRSSAALPSDSIAPPSVSGTSLTPREIEVLGFVASGLTNKDIAEELGVAVGTVERHVANVYAKIGARGRVEATAYAIRHGLTRPLRNKN